VLATAVAGTVLAGCSSLTAAGDGPDPYGVASASSVAASRAAACLDGLTLTWADNNITYCVRLGSKITVDLVAPNHSTYTKIDQIGAALTLQPQPQPLGHFVFEATSPGNTALSGASQVCADAGSCPALPQWNISIVVR
jgi:hypothetical protein